MQIFSPLEKKIFPWTLHMLDKHVNIIFKDTI